MVAKAVRGVPSVSRHQNIIGSFAKAFLASSVVRAVTMAMVMAPAVISPAAAQSFSQALVFGDSTVDSGFYRALGNPGGGPKFNIAFAAAIAAGGTGAPTNKRRQDRAGNSNDGGASEGRTIQQACFRGICQDGPATVIDLAAGCRDNHVTARVDAKNEIVVPIISYKPSGPKHAARSVQPG